LFFKMCLVRPENHDIFAATLFFLIQIVQQKAAAKSVALIAYHADYGVSSRWN